MLQCSWQDSVLIETLWNVNIDTAGIFDGLTRSGINRNIMECKYTVHNAVIDL